MALLVPIVFVVLLTLGVRVAIVMASRNTRHAGRPSAAEMRSAAAAHAAEQTRLPENPQADPEKVAR